MQSHDKWLLKANSDLKASKILCEANCLDVAIYHTQQAAEKALKGFLAAWKRPLVKTHDLMALVALCKECNPDIELIGPLAERLTPFVVIFRYPDVEIYPKKETVLSAIHDAEKIVRAIEALVKSI